MEFPILPFPLSHQVEYPTAIRQEDRSESHAGRALRGLRGGHLFLQRGLLGVVVWLIRIAERTSLVWKL